MNKPISTREMAELLRHQMGYVVSKIGTVDQLAQLAQLHYPASAIRRAVGWLYGHGFVVVDSTNDRGEPVWRLATQEEGAGL